MWTISGCINGAIEIAIHASSIGCQTFYSVVASLGVGCCYVSCYCVLIALLQRQCSSKCARLQHVKESALTLEDIW